MQRMTQDHHAGFLLVLFPLRYQVQPQDWQAMQDRWNLDNADFDLDQYNRRIRQLCASHGIACLDLTDTFREAARTENLYLPFDDHINAAGHELAARATAAYLQHWPAVTQMAQANPGGEPVP